MKRVSGCVFALLTCSSVAAQKQPTEADYYKLEQLPIPDEAYLEAGALEIMPDGRLMASSRRGEVWAFSNPTGDVDKIDVTRYAHGLHEVLGLASRSGWLYCVQRGELTRMKDTDQDGRADVFETVSDAWEINGDYHEYAFGSKFDPSGQLWVVLCLTGSFNSNCKFRGWCLRLDENGKMTPTCSGIRSPGGIGMNAVGDMFYTDNQGPWNGTCSLKWLKPGSFQGHPAGNRWYDLTDMKRPADPRNGSRIAPEADRIPEFVPPAILFPYKKMGQSASGIACDTTGGKFGPFAGQLFVGDQTHSTVMRVCLEKVNGRYQGACFMFRQGIGSGTLPLLMHKSGAMFVGGTNRGWGSRGGKPYSLERLVWTGKTPFEVHRMRARPDGFELTFTQPVDPKTAGDVNSYNMKSYTYIYQAKYGSPEVDHTTPKITQVTVADDKRSARLIVEGLQRGHIHELHMPGVRSAKGLPLLHNVGYYTLNYIPSPPAFGAAGVPYRVPDLKFTPRNAAAELKATLYYRPTGGKEFQSSAIKIDKDVGLTAIVPAEATSRPFEYYAEFAEAGQPPVRRPSDGAASPAKVVLDQNPPSTVPEFAPANVSDLALTLQWKAAGDDNGIAGYRVHRSKQDKFTCSEANRVARVLENSLGWTDTAPPAGETAWYAVQAIDVAGRAGPPRYVKVAVPANRPPKNTLKLTALAAGERAFLRWTGDLEADVVAVEILRGEGKDGALEPVETLSELKTMRFVDEGLKADTSYRYAIRLIDRGKLTSEPSKPELVRAGLFIKRINCGGAEVIGADGIPWEADKGRVSGTALWTAKTTIADAGDIQAVYQTERWSYNSLRYRFDVERGRYAVTLHFAETNPRFAQPGKRTFDVFFNGKKIHGAVDVAAKAGGNRAWQLTTDADVPEKSLIVELRKAKAGPALKGIEVRALPRTD